MGRPPCCDKVGIKKGPWTPEEDIILVSYIQEHGPGNWRAVPTNTGLLRCSKSCRLRWTNYLRPGIKRGNFTPHEEGMIIHLQALLGNKWAAIATYLPQRTDNDIKNYWNTHLKKKLKKFQSNLDPPMGSDPTAAYGHFVPKGYGAAVDQGARINEPSIRIGENSSVYASSAENISRLLEGWMRSSPLHPNAAASYLNGGDDVGHEKFYDAGPAPSQAAAAAVQCYRPQKMEGDVVAEGMPSDQDFAGMLGFDHHGGGLAGIGCDKLSSCDSSQKGSDSSGLADHEQKARGDGNGDNLPLSFLEKWLLDESAGQVEGVMELPPIF